MGQELCAKRLTASRTQFNFKNSSDRTPLFLTILLLSKDGNVICDEWCL